ncbi:MAG: bifunctional (p)ppGpp synthetase/guanosine-3',5'-bis(diphosphate) 3'-pyrophosphohydrolase [Lachnospiraceae bacterium]|nr:bifunctional (p)ppGpp synthetase/guanosine-3',5'-bis(diphosphate) 3'-pyrophosphohydrolase [Lachnospiraceae bacterium]
MLYTKLTIKAMRLAYEAHKEQFDKGGVPYIFHPYHIAEQLDEEYDVCVALLHDVVEDTEVTLEDLENAGFPKEVVEAVGLMTRDKETNYLDYVRRLKSNPIAKKVKLLDLAHNTDPTRLVEDKEKSASLLDRYAKAKAILLDEME